MTPEPGWRPLRVKREWIPEAVWRLFLRHPDPTKRLALKWPWRSLLTRDATGPDEALRWWSE